MKENRTDYFVCFRLDDFIRFVAEMRPTNDNAGADPREDGKLAGGGEDGE